MNRPSKPPPLSTEAVAHIEQARRFLNDYRRLMDAEIYEWAITALFYTALHLVDAWLIHNGIDKPEDRGERHNLIRQPLGCIWSHQRPDYRVLEAASRNARYKMVRFTAAE